MHEGQRVCSTATAAKLCDCSAPMRPKCSAGTQSFARSPPPTLLRTPAPSPHQTRKPADLEIGWRAATEEEGDEGIASAGKVALSEDGVCALDLHPPSPLLPSPCPIVPQRPPTSLDAPSPAALLHPHPSRTPSTTVRRQLVMHSVKCGFREEVLNTGPFYKRTDQFGLSDRIDTTSNAGGAVKGGEGGASQNSGGAGRGA